MAETNGIAWCDATFNPWIGCSKVSLGCDHCYAEVSTPSRMQSILWGPNEARKRTSSANWKLPMRWNNEHAGFFAQHGHRRRVFSASLADVFDNQVDPSWRIELWSLIRGTPHLDWLLLTKRIGNAPAMLPPDWGAGYRNVWLGITAVSQAELDRDAPRLLATPAQLRWLSLEPLLENVSLTNMLVASRYLRAFGGGQAHIDWIVGGGESGPHARLVPVSAFRSLQLQCAGAGIPFFYKQRGGTAKNKGGCLLDGFEAKAWPASISAGEYS